MAGLLDNVDLRTQLAGQNRLELLLFRLAGRQCYGINVFKVREVIQCPPLTHIPKAKAVVRGVSHLRGKTVSIIDLSMALGKKPIGETKDAFVIVTEYNRSTQGFLVDSVDRIVNMKWEDILAPPSGMGSGSYLTAVTRVDGELVEIIDVEKVFAEIADLNTEVSNIVPAEVAKAQRKHVLVVDDSSVARKQITRAMDQIGVTYDVANNGREALDLLQKWADTDAEQLHELGMVITDIEMPEMDGYTLTHEIKQDARLANLYVLLHSSLSGVFNEALVKKVGANEFLPKYNADELSAAVLAQLEKVE